MLITENDMRETVLIQEIIHRVESIDENYANRESDLMFQQQPFLISLILGYRVDLKAEELELVTKCIFVIWEYFKSNEKVKRTKIVEEQFERIHKRNFHLIRYFERETEEAKLKLIELDFDHLKAKALYTGVMHILKINNPLNSKNSQTHAVSLVGMKCLIECFEEIIQESEYAL